jgi:hypothetical protein
MACYKTELIMVVKTFIAWTLLRKAKRTRKIEEISVATKTVARSNLTDLKFDKWQIVKMAS